MTLPNDQTVISEQALREFLLGESELDGKWFGDPDENGHHFWWRKHLRALSHTATSEEEVERAAKAGAFARRSRHDQARDADHYWENCGSETHEIEKRAARAVLSTLRKAELPSARRQA